MHPVAISSTPKWQASGASNGSGEADTIRQLTVLLMPAQAVKSLRPQLRNQNGGQLAQRSLSPQQRRCLESPIQHSLLELGGAAAP